jgi:hypothetical protein
MAMSCVKCGASVTSDAGFCPSCGAPIVASPAGFAAPPPVGAVAPPPPYAQPVRAYPAVPPSSSGGVWKVVLIVIAVVVGLGAIGIGVLGYVGYRAVHSAGSSVALGQAADVSEADLGVSVYPGAVRNANGGVRIKLANVLTVSAAYTTSDPVSSVLTYYQGKLGPGMMARQNGQATTLTSTTVNGTMRDSVIVTVVPSAQAGAQITILHTKTTD